MRQRRRAVPADVAALCGWHLRQEPLSGCRQRPVLPWLCTQHNGTIRWVASCHHNTSSLGERISHPGPRHLVPLTLRAGWVLGR
jgi:hypothetical protein